VLSPSSPSKLPLELKVLLEVVSLSVHSDSSIRSQVHTPLVTSGTYIAIISPSFADSPVIDTSTYSSDGMSSSQVSGTCSGKSSIDASNRMMILITSVESQGRTLEQLEWVYNQPNPVKASLKVDKVIVQADGRVTEKVEL
jgi:hypothetical protein